MKIQQIKNFPDYFVDEDISGNIKTKQKDKTCNNYTH